MKKELKIIVIDDNIVFRNMLCNYLKNEYQYEIIGTASSGIEFFALPKSLCPDVILIDLQMPDMDGYEVGKKLCEDYVTTPLIAITMHTEKAYLQELIEIGFRGCVFKSEIYKSLEQTITKVLDKKLCFPDDINI